MDGPDFLRPPEAARRLGISTRAVRKLLRNRELPGVHLHGIWLIPREDLEAYIANLRKLSQSGLRDPI